MGERISALEFARRAGCHVRQVRRVLTKGALARGADGLIDASLVGSAWRKPNRRTLAKVPADSGAVEAVGNTACEVETPRQAAKRIVESSPEPHSLADSIARKEHFLALLRELEYEQRSGRLIELAQAEEVAFETFRAVRDAWLRWPSKVAPFIAAELDADVDKVAALLSEYVYEQLRELGEPQPDFTAA